MAGQRLPHIVSYDIANPKRLGRVHRHLKRIGLPLQYSVFLVELYPKQRQRLLKELAHIIHAKQDDIRIYPLPATPEWQSFGKALWSEDLLLTGLRLPAHRRYQADLES